MKIIDCFPYFNEKELLELRINLLYEHVDKFIICDANRTHSGKLKPFLCKDHLDELNIPRDKIQIIEVDLSKKPKSIIFSETWMRERAQRNAAAEYIEDDDICYIGDCDEIINPRYIKYYSYVAKENPNNILRVPLVFLNVRADLRVHDENKNPREWSPSYFCMKHHLEKYTLSDIRESKSMSKKIDFSDIFITEDDKIIESGWHFSWMGDLERIKTKCNSFLHHEEFQIADDYKASVNSTDPLGRTDHVLKKYSIDLLPDIIFKLERVKKFLLPDV